MELSSEEGNPHERQGQFKGRLVTVHDYLSVVYPQFMAARADYELHGPSSRPALVSWEVDGMRHAGVAGSVQKSEHLSFLREHRSSAVQPPDFMTSLFED